LSVENVYELDSRNEQRGIVQPMELLIVDGTIKVYFSNRHGY